MSFGENVDELKAVYGKYKLKIDIDDKVVKFAKCGRPNKIYAYMYPSYYTRNQSARQVKASGMKLFTPEA